jgi:hypothetical protein
MLGLIVWLPEFVVARDFFWVQTTVRTADRTTYLNVSSDLPSQSSYETTDLRIPPNSFSSLKYLTSGVIFSLPSNITALDVQFTNPNCVRPIVCVTIGSNPIITLSDNSVALECTYTGIDSGLTRRVNSGKCIQYHFQ